MSTFQNIKALGLWYLKTVELNCDLISLNTTRLRDYEKRRKVFHFLK